jgi:hypothetical protein
VPVICSPECGVVTHDPASLTIVARGDSKALLMNIRDKCKST